MNKSSFKKQFHFQEEATKICLYCNHYLPGCEGRPGQCAHHLRDKPIDVSRHGTCSLFDLTSKKRE